MLSFPRLHVYECAIEFLALAFRILAKLPRGHAGIADQMRRAALSIPLDIAEGAGRTTKPDAARHGIARGSAMECAAIIDALVLLNIVDASEREAALVFLGRIVAMLTKMRGQGTRIVNVNVAVNLNDLARTANPYGLPASL